MYKIILISLFIAINAYSCPIYEKHTPMIDAYISIDAKESNTSFSITWKFKEFYIQSLLSEHDLNKNQKFDKNEQEDIKKELIDYVESNNYITEIVYVKKGQRIKKSLMSKLEIIKSKLIFSDDGIEYKYDFETDFVLEKKHRLFIRFLDPKEKVHLNLQEVLINNYDGKKVIMPQDIRANIYFYDYKPKYRKKKDIKEVLNKR